MQTSQKIAIVGSGLVGTLLAIYLKKQGHTVHVYDRSPDIRTVEFSGRSINLVMSNRGWKTMEDVGLADEIKKEFDTFGFCQVNHSSVQHTSR